MIKLKDILKEWSEKDTGPKRWFKPYGDKYTEWEKHTNHTNKEPIKENNPLEEFDGNQELYDLVRGMSINAYSALSAELGIQNEDVEEMSNWIFDLSHTETAAMIRRIKNKEFEY